MIPVLTLFKMLAQQGSAQEAPPASGIMSQDTQAAPVQSNPAADVANRVANSLDEAYSGIDGYTPARGEAEEEYDGVDLEIYQKYGTAGADVIGQEINLHNLDKAVEQAMALFPEPTGNVTFEKSQEGKEAFLRRMIPVAKQVGKEIGLDWKLIIGQTALETGWGTSVKGNSFFGVKAHGADNTVDFKTTEEEDGEKVSITDSFRAYETPEDSARDYGRFLQDNPRYKDYLAAESLSDAATALQASGYATDSQYGAKVLDIAQGRTLRTFLEDNPDF